MYADENYFSRSRNIVYYVNIANNRAHIIIIIIIPTTDRHYRKLVNMYTVNNGLDSHDRLLNIVNPIGSIGHFRVSSVLLLFPSSTYIL